MGSDLLRIASTGLISHQSALATTGHNISSASVEGYSRQRVEFATANPQLTGAGYIGSGVTLANVARTADQYVINQLRSDLSVYNEFSTFKSSAEQIDSLLANPSTGLSEVVNSFFAAIQDASNNPASLAVRQLVLSSADNLVQRFNGLHDNLNDQVGVINQQMEKMAEQVTILAAGIADLNVKIERALGVSQGHPPNDLLDQRDVLLNKLAELIDIKTIDTRTGGTDVFIAKGQPLVVGNQSHILQAVQGTTDPSQNDLALIVQGGQPQIVSSSVSGGQLGGLLDFRNSIVNQAMNELGRVALGISERMNDQHQLGMDLEGDLGGLLFRGFNDPAIAFSRVLADSQNSNFFDVIGVEIIATDGLTGSDYRLDFIGPAADSYTLTRLIDDTVVATGAVGIVPTVINLDGMRIEFLTNNFQIGDQFTIQPTRSAARDIDLVLRRPEKLALALPVTSEQGAGNTGTGRISGGEMLNVFQSDGVTLLSNFATPGQLTPPLLIRFTSPTTYDVLDNSDPENPVALVPPMTGLSFSPGFDNDIFTESPVSPLYKGFQFVIDGEPETGDTFSINYNAGGKSDNRNALTLAELQTADTMDAGNATFQDVYGFLVSQVGSATRQARMDSDASETLMNQSQALRDSISAVNLDEEAARLIEFEQAYNASAQVINVARQLFDTLISVVD